VKFGTDGLHFLLLVPMASASRFPNLSFLHLESGMSFPLWAYVTREVRYSRSVVRACDLAVPGACISDLVRQDFIFCDFRARPCTIHSLCTLGVSGWGCVGATFSAGFGGA
jgi:hypothetical protein